MSKKSHLLTALFLTAVASSASAADVLWTDGPADGRFGDDDPLTFGAFADLAKLVGPAVLDVRVMIAYAPTMFGPGGVAEGQGSGFIIDPEGYAITNHHVIEDATSIDVTLQDGRTFSAEVVGTDPRSDIALIHIDAPGPLPFAMLGDSEGLRPGEWVMAIGSPYSYSQTVTVGIVSALNRRDIQPFESGGFIYQDYIQTDTPINPGNSGGPLIDIHGNVVGVNAAVHTGNNLGFAIPIHMVRALIPHLATGAVRRSWLGVRIDDVTEEDLQRLGFDVPHGAEIVYIEPGSPAEDADLHVGDVVLRFGDEDIDDSSELPWLASIAGIGTTIPVTVLRDGRERELDVVMGEMGGTSQPEVVPVTPPVVDGPQGTGLGLTLAEMGEDTAQAFGASGAGIVVTAVESGSSAERSGVRVADVLLEVNGQAIQSLDAYESLVGGIESGDIVRMRFRRGNAIVFVAFNV